LGSPHLLQCDRQSGTLDIGVTWVDARGYSNLQSAVDASPAGGSVFFATGERKVPPGGLILDGSICLRGEPGTKLLSNTVAANEPVIRILPGGNQIQNIELHNLFLTCSSRPASALPGHHGLICDIPSDGSKLSGLTLDNISVYNMGDDGIRLTATGLSDSFFVYVTLLRVNCSLSHGHGMHIAFANGLSLTDCFFFSNEKNGLLADSSEISIRGTGFEQNCRAAGLSPDFDAQVRVRNCLIAKFDACRWEGFTTSAQTSRRGLVIENSPGCAVVNCRFVNAALNTTDTTERGIFCTYGGDYAGVMGSVFHGNCFQNVKTSLEIDSTSRPALDCVVFPQFADPGSGDMILPYGAENNGLVMLGGRPSPTSLSTPLQAHGVMLPVMITSGVGDIDAAEAGRLIYNKTLKRLQYWDGSVWRQVATQ
jgi:hypothetical protein